MHYFAQHNAGTAGEICGERRTDSFFLGNAPQYVNAVKSDRGKLLADRAEQIPFNRAVLLEALEQEREIDIDVQALDGEDPTRMKHREEGNRASNLCYQIREDGETRWLFISHVNKPVNEHITWMEQWNIRIKGEYRATVYDTLTGEQAPMETSCQNGNTLAGYVTSQHGSLLMKLTPQKAKNYSKPKEEGSRKTYLQRPEKVQLLAEPKEYRLLEENCCMLDQAGMHGTTAGGRIQRSFCALIICSGQSLAIPADGGAGAAPGQSQKTRTADMFNASFCRGIRNFYAGNPVGYGASGTGGNHLEREKRYLMRTQDFM